MPPQPLLPNQPLGRPDWFSPSQPVTQPSQTRGGVRIIPTENGPAEAPTHWTDQDIASYVAAWEQRVATVTEALKKSSGWEREKNRLALEDAVKGRANAYKIAELSAQTSRYGVDVGRQNQLDSLTEQARQFDANHGLDQQKFGLDVADKYTRYAQTYDDIWALQDFKGALGRVSQGLGPRPVSTSETRPQPKTWESFAALAGYGDMPAVQAGAGPQMNAQQGGGAGMPGQGAGDPRTKAATGILKALPPSATSGHDDNDYAALDALESLYFSGMPGSVEKLGRERQRIARSGLARRGWNPALVEEDRRRSLPWQGSARLA